MKFDPHTGQPVAPPPPRRETPWSRFRGAPRWQQVLGWVGLAIVMLIVVSALAGGGDSKKTAAPTFAGITQGEVHPDPLYTGDSEALDQLKTGGVWCAWSGDHVYLHVRFVNRLAAHVTVHVTPAYHLHNAGDHGDGEDLSVGIDAGATRSWTGDVGHPQGVDGAPTITSCAPAISDISLG